MLIGQHILILGSILHMTPRDEFEGAIFAKQPS